MLYWIYATRLVISLAVFGSAILVGDALERRVPGSLPPEFLLIAIVGLAAAAFLTPIAYRISHRKRRAIGLGFLYSQAMLDVLLFNGIVHITGGSGSPFVPLFIALAAGYALVLPLSSAILTALSAGALYLVLNLTVGGVSGLALVLQVLVIMLVAVTASLVGARFRLVRSELRVVEGELHRLRLDTADVLRHIPSGCITLDASGHLVYMNIAASELCGLDGVDLLGRDLLPVLDQRAPEVASAVRETMESGRRIQDREAEVYPAADSGMGDKAEDPVPVAVSTTMLQDVGAGPSHVILLQDLRSVRQLENLRLRAGKLEAVAELSASLAHELKNPLASVRSAVEQLSARPATDEDEQILGRLIVREADRLSRILSEFSDFARVGVAERRPVDVDRLMTEVIETVRRNPAAEGRATITAEILDDMSGLWGDPELLHRTLFNLVLNAVQVGDPEEAVTVRVVADALRPDGVPSEVSLGHPVRIRVVDDGPGIEAEDLMRIFDPFYTRRQGGSGLGLSIAHRAVQAHGGALIASSNVGEGATFAMVLPRRTGRGRSRSREEPAPADSVSPDLPLQHGSAERGVDESGRARTSAGESAHI